MPRKYDITKSIESTSITFKEFNLISAQIEETTIEVKDFDITMPQDKVIILLRNKYGHTNALQVVSYETTKAYYGMTKEVFTKYARPTNNKDGRNLIKRTLNAYNVEYMYYDMKKGDMYFSNVFIDKIDEEELYTLKGLNMVRKLRETVDTPIVEITNHEKVSEMYGMTVSDFIKYGTVIEYSDMNSEEETNE